MPCFSLYLYRSVGIRIIMNRKTSPKEGKYIYAPEIQYDQTGIDGSFQTVYTHVYCQVICQVTWKSALNDRYHTGVLYWVMSSSTH